MNKWRMPACFFKIIPLFVFVFLALSTRLAICARAQETTESNPPADRPKPPDKDTPRELIYSYYCVRPGWESHLALTNLTSRTFDFTVAIHGLSGRTVTLKPRSISPDEPAEIDLRDSLNDVGADIEGDFSEGSFSILFKGEGNPLAGRLLVKGPHEAWNLGPVWSENEFGSGMIPPRIETLWWELGGSRDVVLTVNNTSSAPVTADCFLDWAGKRHTAAAISFAPHQTRILSVTEALAALGATAFQASIGGVSIVPRGDKPALVAEAKLTDSDSNKVIGLVLFSPQHQPANALDSIAVPIGVPSADSLYAGQGNFTPHIVLRNLLDYEQTIELSAYYPGKDSTGTTQLDSFRLPAYTTRDIPLNNYYNSLPLPLPYFQLRTVYSGPPGSVEAEVRVTEENSGSDDEIPIANEGDGYAGSLVSYWDFDENHDDYVFFTNLSDKPGRFGMKLDAGSGTYFVPVIRLAPHETKFINLREEVARQQPDLNGTLLPKNATEGRLFYNRLDNVPMYGRILQVSRSHGSR